MSESARSVPLLAVDHLSLELRLDGGWTTLVDDMDFTVDAGETLGLVGESGSGKSLTAAAVLGLLPHGIRIRRGAVRFDGRDLATISRRDLQGLRGGEISAIFQDPQNSLNPAFTVGNQMAEAIRAKDRAVTRRAARRAAADLLDRVGITDPEARLRLYPHELSGGMAQRVMIAIAVANRPRILVADEPTTALDVTVQRQILELLASLRDETGMSVLLISHDLSVVSRIADRVAVVYAGQTVEVGHVNKTLDAPRHPYTEALLAAQPTATEKGQPLRAIPGMVPSPAAMPAGCRFAGRCHHVAAGCEELQIWSGTGDGGAGVRCGRSAELVLEGVTVAPRVVTAPRRELPQTPLLRVSGLVKTYPGRHRQTAFTAVDGVSFDIGAGETMGLVGESGAGKSTVGRMILGLTSPTAGTIEFDGAPLPLGSARGIDLRSDIQVVFQNPYATLDPRMRIEDSIAEPLDAPGRMSRGARRSRVLELLDQVGLDSAIAHCRPVELSGGQRQRVAIARALAPSPRLIICDEPVSALDVSTQAQVVNLLQRLQHEFGVAYLFVGHDLSVVFHVCSRVAVMRAGRIVEAGMVEAVYADPQQPYTRELLDARPQLGRAAIA